MKPKTFQIKIAFVIIIAFYSNILFGQNGVSISNNKVAPDPSAMLDIIAADKGLLIPRVELKLVIDNSTIEKPAHGLLVFNTSQNLLEFPKGEGFYYNSGPFDAPVWVKLAVDEVNIAWLQNGNSGLNNLNFVGTTDAVDLVLKSNNKEGLRLTSNGALIVKGDPVAGVTPASGAGTRLMFIPGKSAFRAGTVGSDEWNDANIGKGSIALGSNFGDIGKGPKASNDNSFAFGYETVASGSSSFAAVRGSAEQLRSIAMGYGAASKASSAIALGEATTASGTNALAAGYKTKAEGTRSTALGAENLAHGNYSTAMGWKDTAYGNYSTVMGYSTYANGNYSTAMGYNTRADDDYSTAMGSGSQANGRYSTAIGYNNTAQNDYTVAMGSNNSTDANYGIAIGYGNHTNNTYSTALGFGSVTGGKYAMTFGYYDSAQADYSIALGARTVAKGDISTAMGYKSVASGKNSTATGYNTKAVAEQSFTGGNSSTAQGYNSVAFGIGTVATSYASAVFGRYNVTSLAGAKDYPNCGAIVFQVGNGDDDDNREDALRLNSYGNLYIGGKLDAKGYTCASDIRLKENIKPLQNALDKINNIQPISYYFKDKKEFSDRHQIGFSAQEIQKEFPELSDVNDKGYLTVNYPQMTAVAVEAIKEQQEIINSLQQNVKAQKADIETQKLINIQLDQRNKDLESRMEKLEKIVASAKQ